MSSSTPPSIESVEEQSDPSAKKRRPTEKRKLQNRIAQKRYRDNLKSRLENLERQAAEIAEQQNAAVPDAGSTSQPQIAEQPSAILDDESFEFLLNDFIIPLDSGNSTNQLFPPDSASEDPSFPGFPSLETRFDAPIEAESSGLSIPERISNSNLPTQLDVEFEYDLFMNELSDQIPTPKEPLNQFNQVNESTPPNYSPWGSGRAWSGGKSPAKSIDNFVRLTPDAGTVSKTTVKVFKSPNKTSPYAQLGPTFASELVRQLRLDDSKENMSLVRTALARGYNIRDVFLAGLSSLDKQEALQPRTGFDPYKNTLTLVPTSTLQAYLSNAMALKLPLQGMKSKEFQSPFYQPEALASGNMAELEATWNDLPKALRPTRGQIAVPHHPWMDMIPFPTLRERALTLSALDPPLIDLWDFKNDVFMNSGLFCWRMGGQGGTGQPWDMRSWEAEPWFLKKWWILVGGETGEVWAQTHWWRTMRGKPKVEMDGAMI